MQSHLTAEMNSKSVKVLIAIDVPNQTLFELLFITLQRCAAKTDIEKQANRHLPLTETHVTITYKKEKEKKKPTWQPNQMSPRHHSKYWRTPRLDHRVFGSHKTRFLVFELASLALSASKFQLPQPLSVFESLISVSSFSQRETERAIWNWNPPSSSHCGLFLSLSFWDFHASIPGTCVCVCVWVSCVFIIYVPLIWCVF